MYSAYTIFPGPTPLSKLTVPANGTKRSRHSASTGSEPGLNGRSMLMRGKSQMAL